ncbi:hypothetical protein IJG79_00990 [Candidatus Saccharibacteria bacterium]|nr:hypothetical protein [Candidatus Saccharibacteria bacterium]
MQTFTTREAEIAATGGILGGMFAVVIAFYIITIIASWRIFVKAGEKGWKSLIPIYNFYILYKICGMKKWFWISIIVSIAVSVLLAIFKFDSVALYDAEKLKAVNWSDNVPALCVLIAECIFALIVNIMYVRNTSKVFGKGVGFAICLFFFTPICWLILGFGKAKYNKKALKK